MNYNKVILLLKHINNITIGLMQLVRPENVRGNIIYKKKFETLNTVYFSIMKKSGLEA